MESNWQIWVARAWAEARHLLGLETGAQIVLRALVTLAVVYGLLFLGSEDAGRDEVVARAIGLGAVLLLAPVVFGWQLITAPFRTERALRIAATRELEELKARRQPEVRLTAANPLSNIEQVTQRQPDGLQVRTRKNVTYLRVKVSSVSDHSAIGHLSITRFWRSTNGSVFDEIELPNSVHVGDFSVDPGMTDYVTYAKVSESDNALRISNWPLILENLVEAGVTYRFLFRAHFWERSAEVLVELHWSGDRHTLRNTDIADAQIA